MSFIPVETTHYSIYNARMAAAMSEKMFFSDLCDADVYVDFGSADGELLRQLHIRKPNSVLIGFDASDVELDRARLLTPEAMFFQSWEDLLVALEPYREKTIALIASSVVHEVYSYGDEEEGDIFWKRLNEGPFTHFIMRDMTFSKLDRGTLETTRAQKVRQAFPASYISDFEEIWGSIRDRVNLTHFLLTYRYTDNWDHEVAENYLPIAREDVLRKVEEAFDIEHLEVENLPFLEERLQSDFGITFPAPTHIKMIARRR